jgi:hypothetical protein
MPGRPGGILDKKYRRALESQAPQTLLTTTLAPAGPPPGLPPGAQLLPDRLSARSPGAVEGRGMADGPLVVLLGQDRIYGDPGQSATADVQLPTPRALPRLLRGDATWTMPRLIGQDAVYAGPGQVAGYEWPVPKGRTPAVEMRTLVAMPLPELFGQDAFYGAAGQVPTFDVPPPLRLARRGQVEPLPGSPGLLAPPPAVPPPGAQVAPDRLWRGGGAVGLRTIDRGLLPVLLGQDAVYAGPGQVPTYDWQLTVPARVPRLWRGHAAWTTPILVGQDAIYGAAGQAAGYEWPVPGGRKPAEALRSWLLSLVLGPLAGQDRVYGDPGQVQTVDWPLATPARMRAVDLRSWLIATVTNVLRGQDVLYGAPGEVQGLADPLSVPRRTSRADWLAQATWALFSAIPPVPPPGDQLLPERVWGRPPSERPGSLAALLLVLIGQDRLYGASGQVAPYDWPLTTPARKRALELLSRLGATLPQLRGQDVIYADPGEAAPYDWPVPNRPAPSRDLRGGLLTLVTTTLLGQDRLYGGPGQVVPYEWAVVRAGRRPLQAEPAVLAALLAPAVAVPTVPPDWPVTRSRPMTVELRTLADGPLVVLLGQDRFFGAPGETTVADWTMPRRGPAGRQDAIVAAVAALTAAVAPQAGWDWAPRPMARRGPVEGWVQAGQLVLPAPLVLAVWPERMVARPGRQDGGPQAPLPALLVQLTTPFQVADTGLWTPRAARRPEGPRPWTTLTLLGRDVLYWSPGEVAPYSWPVPGGRPPHRENRTLVVGLAGSAAYAEPGQVPMYDWPVTRTVVTNRFVAWEQESGRLVRLPIAIDLVVRARPLGLQAGPAILTLEVRVRPVGLGTDERDLDLAVRIRALLLEILGRG